MRISLRTAAAVEGDHQVGIEAAATARTSLFFAHHRQDGWTPEEKDITYRLGPHSSYPVQLFLTAPARVAGTQPQELRWTLLEGGKQVGKTSLLVYPEYNGVPQ